MAEAGEPGHWEIVQTMSRLVRTRSRSLPIGRSRSSASTAEPVVELRVRQHAGVDAQLQRPPSDHRHEGMALVIDARKTRETGSVGGSIR